ncbi:MAG: hypothetical protein RBR02_06355 [Desulfuromonadaceae bacterium]|nr:hypothetical protein [Desulfuromonadaceae bacterium]
MELENKAANVDDLENTAESQPTSPVEKKELTETQAVAKRIKEEKAKARDEFARSLGYESAEDMIAQSTKKTLEEHGLEPTQALEVFTKLKNTDPEIQELKKFKEEQIKLAEELFAKEQLRSVNESFGTTFKSLDELKLSKKTISLFEEGKLSLEEAVRLDRQDLLEKKLSSQYKQNGKDHLKQIEGNGGTDQKNVYVNDQELNIAKRWFGNNMTKEEIEKQLKSA